jgi:dephospho-CoA kinase
VLKVGLTGNIAAGKSSVVAEWRALGAHVIDADELARRAVEPGSSSLAAIVDRWGSPVLDAEGRLDRAAVRDIVFRDPAERAALEAIVHPEVHRLREAELDAAAERGERVVVSDIPLLFEVGLEREFDRVVLVHAPEAQRRARLVHGRRLTVEEADRMIAAQMPAQEKLARADLVIQNDGTREQLRARARTAWEALLREVEPQ